MNRRHTCEAEIEFILEQEAFMNTLWNLYDQGSLQLKVTHNDTKLNNVLLDAVVRVFVLSIWIL